MNQRDTTYVKWFAIAGGILLVIAALIEYWPSQSALQWLAIDEAKSRAVTQKKPVLVDVYAEWCGPCKSMEKTVFPDDSVQLILNSRYILAKINGDDAVLGDTLRKQYRIKAYPTYIVLTPTGKERKRHVGFFPRDQFIRWLADSTDVQILQWPGFDRAVQEAVAQKRRIMVLILKSNDDIEATNDMFQEQAVSELLGKHFVPTLLVSANSLDRPTIDQLGAKEGSGVGEVIILENDRREVGRFRIDSQMEFSSSALAGKLTELIAK